ncbi:MAG: DNA repair protein RecO [Geobacter sp.]|nr:DNA repair protein RecO [Geobacter sp.]
MHQESSEAIVLSVMDYGEADRIATLFTPERGKIRALARNARTSRRRFGGALEPFARLQVRIVLRDDRLSILHDADIITLHPAIRRDLATLALAGYASELCDRFLPDHHANHRLFRLLAACLAHLESAPYDQSDRRFFEINLLNILGYRPSLDQCTRCGAGLPPDPGARYVASASGLLCSECGDEGRIAGETVMLLQKSLGTGRFGVVRFNEQQAAEAGRLLDMAITAHLDRPLKSIGFLCEMTQTPPCHNLS